MSKINSTYETALQYVIDNGVHKEDRTGTGTTSVFSYQMRHNLQEGFPLITTKKVHFKSLAVEMFWFLRGESNIKYLKENGVSIWDEWADENGDLGPVYGFQWRHWRTKEGKEIDQIANLIEGIKNNPDSRRHILTAWNVGEIDDMALPPCHMTAQFYVADGKLSCHLYQRSGDIFLGIPYNQGNYSILLHLIALETGLQAHELVHTIGDLHLYDNHREQAELQLTREVRPFPTLKINKRNSIDEYSFEDLTLEGYDPHPGIKAPVAV